MSKSKTEKEYLPQNHAQAFYTTSLYLYHCSLFPTGRANYSILCYTFFNVGSTNVGYLFDHTLWFIFQLTVTHMNYNME